MTISGEPRHSDRLPDRVGDPADSGIVKLWAALGTVVIVVIVSAWVRWSLSGHFQSPPVGQDRYGNLWALRLVELVSTSAVAILGWMYLIRPWSRAREFTFEGKLLLACVFVYYLEPICNYYNVSIAENAYGVSFGSWAPYIPGYGSPDGENFSAGIFWLFPMYVIWGLVSALIGTAILRTTSRRWPRLSKVSHYTIVYLVLAPGSLLAENFIYNRNEIYVWAGIPSFGALWPGTLYQFSVFEMILVGFYGLGYVWLRDSIDDNGHSAVERGIEGLKASPPVRHVVSLLAITGFAVIWPLSVYFLPTAFISMHNDSFAPLPSYLQGGAYCGTPNSTHDCPSTYLKKMRGGCGTTQCSNSKPL